VTYCTREDVQRALDVKSTARNATQIDRIITDVAESIEAQMVRVFYPTVATRRFDWPNLASSTPGYPWRIWLNQNDLISVDTFTSGGTVIAGSGCLLEPVNEGPPYTRIDINLGTNSAFSSSATWQQSQVIAGTWGYNLATTPGGALAAALGDTTGTTVDVTDGSTVGVGSLIVCGTERMLVTGRQALTSAQVVGAAGMTAASNNNTLPITDGTKYFVDEILTVDSERMLVYDITGNNVAVKRAFDGTALAIHTAGATVYTSRRLTVVRGAYGTTAATHLSGAAVSIHLAPSLIRSLSIAEAVNRLLNEESGYARTIGSGDAERSMSLTALRDLRAQAYSEHGRQMRMRSV
jgi:hypothetical protein